MFSNLKKKLGLKSSSTHLKLASSHFEACASEGKEAVAAAASSAYNTAKATAAGYSGLTVAENIVGKAWAAHGLTFHSAAAPGVLSAAIKVIYNLAFKFPTTLCYAAVGGAIYLFAANAPEEAVVKAYEAGGHSLTAAKEGAIGIFDVVEAGAAGVLDVGSFVEENCTDAYALVAGESFDFDINLEDFVL